mgnify:CR=1 FL=1
MVTDAAILENIKQQEKKLNELNAKVEELLNYRNKQRYPVVPLLLRLALFGFAGVVIVSYDRFSIIFWGKGGGDLNRTDEIDEKDNKINFVQRFQMYVLTCILIHVMFEVEVFAGGGAAQNDRWIKRVLNESITLWCLGCIIHNIEGFITSVAAVGGIIMTGNIFKPNKKRGRLPPSESFDIVTEASGIKQMGREPVPRAQARGRVGKVLVPVPVPVPAVTLSQSIHVFDHATKNEINCSNEHAMSTNDNARVFFNKDTGESINIEALEKLNALVHKFEKKTNGKISGKKKKARHSMTSFFTPPRFPSSNSNSNSNSSKRKSTMSTLHDDTPWHDNGRKLSF